MKKFLNIFLAAVMLYAMTACSTKKTSQISQTPAENINPEKTVITLSFSTGMDDPRAIAAEQFKAEVEEKTNGKIQIDIKPDGNDTELIESIIKGSMDMTISSAGNFAVYYPQIGISGMPFLFSNFSEAWDFLDKPFFTDIYKEMEEYNIVVLSNFDNGFRCVTTTDKEISDSDDMKGLSIRTPPNQIIMETMSALGATPKPYAFPELKNALREGKFNSQENPVPVIYNSKLYEEQKFLAVTNHCYDAMPMVIRKDLWNSLSMENQNIIRNAAINAQNLNRKIVKDQTDSYVEKLKTQGMTITYPVLNEFKEKSKSVYKLYSAVYGKDLMNQITK